MSNPSHYLNGLPGRIRPAETMHIPFLQARWQVHDLLFEHRIDTCREAARSWWTRVDAKFAPEISDDFILFGTSARGLARKVRSHSFQRRRVR